jgi:uncharacterized protein (TIGR03083 family)
MQHDDYLQVIRREGAALLDAAERAPHAPVPSCAGWDMSDLVWHTAEVHQFWASIVDGSLAGPEQYEEPPRPDDGVVLAEARTSLASLVRVLSDADPDHEVWTWSSGNDVAWVARRMAQETAVHRWDAEQAAGIDATIDPALASDGIDEYLSFFLVPCEGAAGSVHLHSTDATGEWVVRFDDGGLQVTREHAKGDAAVRGPATDLLLALWGRVPLEQVEIIGDRAAVDRLWSLGVRG